MKINDEVRIFRVNIMTFRSSLKARRIRRRKRIQMMYDILKNEKHQTKQRYKKRKKYYGRRNVFPFKVKDKE